VYEPVWDIGSAMSLWSYKGGFLGNWMEYMDLNFSLAPEDTFHLKILLLAVRLTFPALLLHFRGLFIEVAL
jgi:hypothetical protein